MMFHRSQLFWSLLFLLFIASETGNAQVLNSANATLLNEPIIGPPDNKLDEAANNDDAAGNDQIARVMKEFQGRGDLGDGSQPLSPQDTVAQLKVPNNLVIELVAGEPDVQQPIHISFDSKGRMWVVQYKQYPFPAGLKVLRYDQHLRAVFDRIPNPPPNHTAGADSILVFEDNDGDGTYETRHEVIAGLNIATSVAVGRGGIWVMNPPYLLFYPDVDGDAMPDSSPIVHLSGFGLEDTHSVANSLFLAPDGWLYGVNGSTTTAKIHVEDSQQEDVRFQGQCVWRYQPESKKFEIYAEGGGNPFGLEFDAAGQVFSGTNWGDTRGMHYPQGSYGVKNWGKHGPLTNPNAFGFFHHMPFEGDGRRFTEEYVIYDDVAFPAEYHRKMLAINPLQRIAFVTDVKQYGSTFRTVDLATLVESKDRWFRPVDITVGPDGSVYIADWYDTRLTHVDPRDNWHKTSGRIYRIRPREHNSNRSDQFDFITSETSFDLNELTNDQLSHLLGHPSRWFRFAAVEELANRNSQATGRQLLEIAKDSQGTRSLGALWAASRILGIEEIAMDKTCLKQLLNHALPDIRRWTIRLIGDAKLSIEGLETELLDMANRERDAQVRSQLASTAARLPYPAGISLLIEMLSCDLEADRSDPHIPLLIWWGIEKHFAVFDPQTGHERFAMQSWLAGNSSAWQSRLLRDAVLSRYARRCAVAGDEQSLRWCAELLESAPDQMARELVFRGIEKGLADTPNTEFPDVLTEAICRVKEGFPLTDLKLRIRKGDEAAIAEAVLQVRSDKALISDRIELITLLGEIQASTSLTALKALLNDEVIAIRRSALVALSRFADPSIGSTIAEAYQSSMDDSTGLRPIAVRVLSSRLPWARRLIDEIKNLRIDVELVTPDMVTQMQSFGDETIAADIHIIWGKVRSTPEEKIRQIDNISEILMSNNGNITRGKELFSANCGKCHRMFGEGGDFGPDLTGYERSNLPFLTLAVIDPSAAIREEYTQYQVLTTNGQALSGMLVNQTSSTLTIKTAEGQSLEIALDEVEQFSASPVSLMPEKLIDPLSNQQIADLFSFLMQ